MQLAMDERVTGLEVAMRHLVNEWVPALEVKVERLDTYAGPGQNEAFSDNFLEIRTKLDQISSVQGRHTRALNQHGKMLTGLKSDVRTLKADMVEVKGALAEILDRLPPKEA